MNKTIHSYYVPIRLHHDDWCLFKNIIQKLSWGQRLVVHIALGEYNQVVRPWGPTLRMRMTRIMIASIYAHGMLGH